MSPEMGVAIGGTTVVQAGERPCYKSDCSADFDGGDIPNPIGYPNLLFPHQSANAAYTRTGHFPGERWLVLAEATFSRPGGLVIHEAVHVSHILHERGTSTRVSR